MFRRYNEHQVVCSPPCARQRKTRLQAAARSAREPYRFSKPGEGMTRIGREFTNG